MKVKEGVVVVKVKITEIRVKKKELAVAEVKKVWESLSITTCTRLPRFVSGEHPRYNCLFH